jgi:protein subunit release factor B
MDIYKEIIIDVISGEEEKIEFSQEELLEIEKAKQEFQAKLAQQEQEEASRKLAKETAKAKLSALGLTEAEIKALAGN